MKYNNKIMSANNMSTFTRCSHYLAKQTLLLISVLHVFDVSGLSAVLKVNLNKRSYSKEVSNK